jgi:hypothetical protein
MSGTVHSDKSVILICLEGLEQRLTELTEDVSRLALIFEKESEDSSMCSIVAGCLECLLADRLKPACEALAMVRDLEMANDASLGEPREGQWPA